MNTEFTRKFSQQVMVCNDQKIRNKILETIQFCTKASSMSEVRNVKKLSGYKNYYRIRIGDYRIGIEVNKDIIIFAAFDHRSNIYKYFP